MIPLCVFTCGSLSSLPASWMVSQARDLRSCSQSSLNPSKEEGVLARRSRGRTLLEMSSTMDPNSGRPEDVEVPGCPAVADPDPTGEGAAPDGEVDMVVGKEAVGNNVGSSCPKECQISRKFTK